MKKILKIKIPVEMQVAFKGLEVDCEERLAEIILDFGRQLNNLKLVSDVMPIGIYPRFHLSGDLNEYTITSTGDYALEGRLPSNNNKWETLRVPGGQRQDSGVQETPSLQQGKSLAVPQEVRIAYIKKTINNYETGLLNGRETLEIIYAVLRVLFENLEKAVKI